MFYKKKKYWTYMLSLVLLTPPPPKKSIRHQFQAAEMFKHANANFRQFRI